MSRVLIVMPAATLALAVLAGCGQDPASSAAPIAEKASATADPQAKRRQMEAMRADCMKQKGFKYHQNVPAPGKPVAEKVQEQTGEYEAIKQYRQKYGFGVFASHVYLDPTAKEQLGNLNAPILRALSQTQRQAWEAADESCYGAAFSKFTGKKVTSLFDAFTQMDKRSRDLRSRQLDGDAQLVKLAQSFGDCLKGSGKKVSSLKPTQISQNGQLSFEAESARIGAKQNPDAKGEGIFVPQLTADQARPYLAREIKAALEDLECGRDFYAAFNPKSREVSEKVNAEFGVTDGLFG